MPVRGAKLDGKFPFPLKLPMPALIDNVIRKARVRNGSGLTLERQASLSCLPFPPRRNEGLCNLSALLTCEQKALFIKVINLKPIK